VTVAFVVSVIILFMMRRLGTNDTQVAVALMLVLGGAVGNVIDRVRFGYVVDFIDVLLPRLALADLQRRGFGHHHRCRAAGAGCPGTHLAP